MAISRRTPSGFSSRQALTSPYLTRQRGTILDFSPIPVSFRMTSWSSGVAGQAGLDGVDAELVELEGNEDLLFWRERDARGLLAVARRDVVDADPLRRRHFHLDVRGGAVKTVPMEYRRRDSPNSAASGTAAFRGGVRGRSGRLSPVPGRDAGAFLHHRGLRHPAHRLS